MLPSRPQGRQHSWHDSSTEPGQRSSGTLSGPLCAVRMACARRDTAAAARWVASSKAVRASAAGKMSADKASSGTASCTHPLTATTHLQGAAACEVWRVFLRLGTIQAERRLDDCCGYDGFREVSRGAHVHRASPASEGQACTSNRQIACRVPGCRARAGVPLVCVAMPAGCSHAQRDSQARLGFQEHAGRTCQVLRSHQVWRQAALDDPLAHAHICLHRGTCVCPSDSASGGS